MGLNMCKETIDWLYLNQIPNIMYWLINYYKETLCNLDNLNSNWTISSHTIYEKYVDIMVELPLFAVPSLTNILNIEFFLFFDFGLNNDNHSIQLFSYKPNYWFLVHCKLKNIVIFLEQNLYILQIWVDSWWTLIYFIFLFLGYNLNPYIQQASNRQYRSKVLQKILKISWVNLHTYTKQTIF